MSQVPTAETTIELRPERMGVQPVRRYRALNFQGPKIFPTQPRRPAAHQAPGSKTGQFSSVRLRKALTPPSRMPPRLVSRPRDRFFVFSSVHARAATKNYASGRRLAAWVARQRAIEPLSEPQASKQ